MRYCGWIFGLLLLPLLAAPVALAAGEAGQTQAAPQARDIAPEAAGSMEAMCGYLKSLASFRFVAEVETDQLYPNGQAIQVSRTATVAVKRPDKAYSHVVGDDRDRVLVYDGKTVTIADLDRGVYAVADAPPTLDATIDMLSEKYGLSAPLGDLLYADPCPEMLENVRTGDCVGTHQAMGKACDHLAFTQKNADWQMWVEKGKAPVPRKLVINDKELMGWPQYQVTFTDWEANPRLQAGLFTFKPLEGMRRIEFLPLVETSDKSK
ncbi:MAG: DUF2092 domain-containing protein [Solidesulfovibrio sp. DCME]|uniref:DUF2092 domain-containing protein n=1 Tax=Solidesulfovibrio sp. DCME TaxID=3447380 RepID=UPI003D09CD20